MSSYHVHEAKSNLSRLLQKTAAGEEGVIVRDGVPVVAQAIAEDLPLLTSDECIRQYPARCVW